MRFRNRHWLKLLRVCGSGALIALARESATPNVRRLMFDTVQPQAQSVIIGVCKAFGFFDHSSFLVSDEF